MSILGKLHEISFYGLITNIVCLVMKKISISELINYGFHPQGFPALFFCYLFWASILFIPIAIIGAYETKYVDYGEGLTFESQFILIIIMSHIAEELLGLVMSPFWLLKDIFTKNFNFGKVIDYISYAALVIFIIVSLIYIW